jgi:hypothetical protein
MKLPVGQRTQIVLDELRQLIGRATNIRLVADAMSDDEIAALRRPEGFGLSIYEALLLGKCVVATHWSANAEYGPRFPNDVGVPCRMSGYRDGTGHYADGGFEWADAIEPELRLDTVGKKALAADSSDGLERGCVNDRSR